MILTIRNFCFIIKTSNSKTKYDTMEQNKKDPVKQYYYSDKEWDRLGCGPLPEERKRENFMDACARGNPKIDGKAVKGYN
jgi:hypothetical protein